MLQGTFETLSLPEVLGLLASARKSGALWLEAGPVTGVMHLEDGHCRAGETAEQRGPVDGSPALLARLVDMCFAVMCQEAGSFRFAADDPAPWTCAEPIELSDVLVEVDRLLKQWREILRVIPSLECRPQLLDALEVDELVIDRERWTLLVAMDGRRTVRELVQRTNRPMIELCQTLLELIEAGAIGVIDPAAARTEDPAAPGMAAQAVAAPEPAAPAVVAPAPVEAVAAAAAVAAPDATPVVLTVVPPDTETEAPAEAQPPAAAESVPAPPAPADEAGDDAADADADARPEPVPVAVGSDAPDKGAFLRLFSGLRDS